MRRRGRGGEEATATATYVFPTHVNMLKHVRGEGWGGLEEEEGWGG